MAILFVSDIFGKTQPLVELAALTDKKARIFDPYDTVNMEFTNEQEAYQFFTANVGLEEYDRKLKRHLTQLNEPTTVVGFSVGASAIWNLSGHQTVDNVRKGICYYGSQIRNNVSVIPQFPIQLVFPVQEAHFSVSKLISALSTKPHTDIRQVSYLHGFMNKLSANFDEQGYRSELDRLRNYLNNV